MSDFQAVITQAGLNAAVSASDSGITIEITHIAAGTGRYTPNRDYTTLGNEVARVPVAGGTKPAATQMHLTAEFSEGEFAATEIGFFLADGTLFALWSHPTNVLFYKTALGRVIQAFDLVLDAIPADSISFVSNNELPLYYAAEFVQMTTAQTRMATAMVQGMLQQIHVNDRLLNIGA